MPLKESSKISLNIDEVLFISLKTMYGHLLMFRILLQSFIHLLTKFCRSESNSATFFSLATVLTITPKFLGLMLLTSLLRRVLSSLLSIF